MLPTTHDTQDGPPAPTKNQPACNAQQRQAAMGLSLARPTSNLPQPQCGVWALGSVT